MNWRQVMGSSNVAAIAYDEEKQECYVKFLSGQIYVYENVGPGIWEEFQSSQSKGRFVGIQLRRAHPFHRVPDNALDESSTGGEDPQAA